MKTIILFRHGQTANGDFNHDIDRPLSSTGIKDVKEMGLYLSQNDDIPDIIISSPALRAKTTAEIAITDGKWNCPMHIEAGIYKGTHSFLLNLAKKQNDDLSSICLVGHEPNLSSFIAQATDGKYQQFPTASMAKIYFDLDEWTHLAYKFGKLAWSKRTSN